MAADSERKQLGRQMSDTGHSSAALFSFRFGTPMKLTTFLRDRIIRGRYGFRLSPHLERCHRCPLSFDIAV